MYTRILFHRFVYPILSYRASMATDPARGPLTL